MTHWKQNNEKMDKYAHLSLSISPNHLKRTPSCFVVKAHKRWPGSSSRNALFLSSGLKNRNENDDGEGESLGSMIIHGKTAAFMMLNLLRL